MARSHVANAKQTTGNGGNLVNGYEFRTALAKIAPDYALDVDNYGQIVIYTNLKEIDNDQYVKWTEEETA